MLISCKPCYLILCLFRLVLIYLNKYCLNKTKCFLSSGRGYGQSDHNTHS